MTTPHPPQRPPPPVYYYPPPSRRRRIWLWVVGSIFALIVLGNVVNGGSNSTGSGTSTSSNTPAYGGLSTTSISNAEDDVAVSKCVTRGNVIGMADIAVRITNSTKSERERRRW